MKNQFFFDKNLPFCELRSSNNNSHYKEHLHDTLSIGVIEKGEVAFTYLHNNYTLKENQLVIIPPQKVHSCNPIDNNPRKYYMMYLNEQWCFHIQKELFPDLTSLKSIKNPLLHSQSFYTYFLDLCKLLFLEIPTYEKEYELISFISDLFSHLYKKESFIEIEDGELSNRVINFLEENLEKSISLDLLSKEFGYNKFFLSRVFKTHTGLPPHTYHLNLKINRAKDLLRAGMNISQVSLTLGFADQSHFHRNFVKFISATPKEYIKKKSILYKN